MTKKNGRPDKLNLLPAFLDALITTPSIATAAQRVGIGASTIMRYLVRSRMGDPELQEVEWMGVTASFHQHATVNARALTAQLVQGAALDRALNGHMADVFYQGVRQTERVLKPEYQGKSDDELALIVGPDWEKECYEVRPTMQHMKPSDALVLRVMEAFDKRYKPSQTIDVVYGGTLRLERPGEQTVKVIEHKPVFEDAVETEQRGGHLALARPAKDAAELDQWNKEGQFKPSPVAFVDADGKRTVLEAATVSAPLALTSSTPAKRSGPPISRDPFMNADGTPKPGGFRVR